LFSVTATGLQNSSASFRLFSRDFGFSPWVYSKNYPASPYFNRYSFAKVGKIAGRLSFGIGVVSDGIGVFNYYQNPNSPNAVHPGKAGVNTAMGAWGFTGVGTIPAIFYFGAEAFYPGGALQLFNDSGNWHDDTKRILGPGWRPIPFGPK
jgi:hypothetical protein